MTLCRLSHRNDDCFDRRHALPKSGLIWHGHRRRLGRLRNRCGLSLSGGAAWYAGGILPLQLTGESWAMHAEPGELVGHAYSKAPIVTGSAPGSPSAALISTDLKEAGLWLWQGELPPSPPSLPEPKSHALQILRRIMPAAKWAGWLALPSGLALISIAMSMMPHRDGPVSTDTPAVALSPAQSPTVARPIVTVPPAELTPAPLDQAQVPSAPAAISTAQGPEPPVAKGRVQRKLSRTGRKIHASHILKGPLFPMHGVLTPPVMTWHGGGY